VVRQYQGADFSSTTWPDSSSSGVDMDISGATPTTLANGDAGGSFDGVDDNGQVSFPPELSGAGLQSFGIEFTMQTVSTNSGVDILKTDNGTQILEIRLNEKNFNNQSGNLTFLLRDSSRVDLAGTFDTNPNLNDGATHKILWNVVDANSNSMELYVDGVQQSISFFSKESPSNFNNFNFDFTVGAENRQGSLVRFSDISLGTMRLHGQSISGPTL
jgi:hypothetical protein